MQTFSKLWESKALIRFPDCDPFNHLNNARYIDYFINAREDHIIANMNFNIYHFAAEHGLGWVVSKNQVAYLKPAFLMETVVIDSVLLKLGETDILVEMKMWNERKDKLKAVLWSNFVHINMKTQKPQAHSQHLLDMFRPFEDPLAPPIGFDDRVNQLRGILGYEKG
ncbi:MAG: acyl-CoA thioesterase [Ferruginibacter sp.]